jgi:hypothetical protein
VTKEPCFIGFLRGSRERYDSAPVEMCVTMRRFCDGNLSFGTVAERIAPESLTPGIVLLRSPQHIAQMATPDTRSSLQPAFKRRFDDEILKPRDGHESNQN